MTGFVGREFEMGLLTKRLERVKQSGSGVAVAIRGRRQVGKSRLVQEFCNRAKVPYLYFTATKGVSSVRSVTTFLRRLAASSLVDNRETISSARITDGWQDAFEALAAALPRLPAVVVIDEVPWLTEQDNVFDGALQTAWDRLLSSQPVLLLLLGSDMHMMERLTAYDRPFFGRADIMRLGPLNPAETGSALGLTGADAIDARLITGGLPGLMRAWPHSTPPLTFLETECTDPTAPLYSVPEAALSAEFSTPDQARRVIESVGSGDRTYATIAAAAGNPEGTIPSGSLSPLLRRLTDEKRVLAVDHPLSTQPGKPGLYRVADTNLRLYMAFGYFAREQAERGLAEASVDIVRKRWTTWRGRAVEPIIREALEISAVRGQLPWPDVTKVGGWWNRQFNPEIDLIGADRGPVAGQVHFAGSIKWLNSPFDNRDLDALRNGAGQVPGFTPTNDSLAVVSLSGTVNLDNVALTWGPEDVVAAWSTSA